MPAMSDGGTPASAPRAADANRQVTSELVDRVAERVYAMFLRDLQLARERRGALGSMADGGPLWQRQGGK